MQDQDISVIIPTFNRSQMLVQAVNSVLKQSKVAKEILVIDDGSTDDTALVIKELRTFSPVDIKYFRQDNKGPAAARNWGINHATSTFLAFLDSDDYWHKSKLETQHNEMLKNSQYLISHTKEKWYRRGRHLNQKKYHQPQHGNIFAQCLKLCCVGMSTVMTRKQLFSQYGFFDEQLRCCEDYDYWLRVAVHESFLLVNQPLTIKNGGREDQVSEIFKTGMDRFRIRSLVNLLAQSQLTDDQQKLVSNMITSKCKIYGSGCIKHGKKREGLFYLELAQTVSSKVST